MRFLFGLTCLATVLGACSTSAMPGPPACPSGEPLDWSNPAALEEWFASVREDLAAGRLDHAADRVERFEDRVMTSKDVPEEARLFLKRHMRRAHMALEFSLEVRKLGLRSARVVATGDGFEVVLREQRYHPGDWLNENLYLRSADISTDPNELTFVYKGYTFLCAVDR